jgi:hypothetical protein
VTLELGDQRRGALLSARAGLARAICAHGAAARTLNRFDFFQGVRESTGMIVKT